MQKVENGLFVSVDYTGTLASGEVFDSSKDREPIEVHMGAGNMIPGFESALLDMSLNESKTFTLSPEEAYGHRDDSRTYDFPRSEIPQGTEPEVGQILALTNPDGQQIPARVDRMDDETVFFDLNHPLAGESLTFTVEVLGINKTALQQNQGCGCSSSSDKCGCGNSGCC